MANLSKRTRGIIAGLSALIVLGGIFLFLHLTKPEEPKVETPTVEDTKIALIDKNSEEITEVLIKNTKDEYKIYKLDGEWMADGLENSPLNDVQLNALIKTISQIKATSLIEENSQKQEEFGLLKPDGEVEIHFDKEVIKFKIGKLNPAETDLYFSMEDSEDVYLVSVSQLANLLYDRYAFVSNVVTQPNNVENPITVNKMTIQRDDLEKPIIIEALPEVEGDEIPSSFSSHKLVSPFSISADVTRGEATINGMFGLVASMAVRTNLDEVDYEIAQINKPTAVVTVETSEGISKLTIGKAITEKTKATEDSPEVEEITGYYGVYDGIDVLYIFSKASLPWVDVTASDIMSRLFLTPYIYTVDEMEITVDDSIYTYDIIGDAEESSVKLNGEEKDMDAFKKLYQFVISATGEELYSDDVEGEPFVTVRYKYRDKEIPDDVIEYYKSADERKMIIKINGEILYKIRHMFTEKLISNIQALETGGNVSLEW